MNSLPPSSSNVSTPSMKVLFINKILRNTIFQTFRDFRLFNHSRYIHTRFAVYLCICIIPNENLSHKHTFAPTHTLEYRSETLWRLRNYTIKIRLIILTNMRKF